MEERLSKRTEARAAEAGGSRVGKTGSWELRCSGPGGTVRSREGTCDETPPLGQGAQEREPFAGAAGGGRAQSQSSGKAGRLQDGSALGVRCKSHMELGTRAS